MNQPIPTGPDLFGFATDNHDKARSHPYGDPMEAYHQNEAAFHSGQARTAAIVMLTEVIATATGADHHDLDAWRSKIGMTYPWDDASFTIDGILAPNGTEGESWEVTYRVPGHVARRDNLTEAQVNVEFPHAQPAYRRLSRKPEPKHVRIPVGTRVLVSDLVYNEDTGVPERTNPQPGRISGHAPNGTYRWQYEHNPGVYSSHESFAFMDNRVQVHPDGPECPPNPAEVKHPPTGPRVYVRKRSGRQGHIVDLATEIGNDGLRTVEVQWYTPGAHPVWVRVLDLEIITASEVDRCPFGQTGDECGSGENQCEQCVMADDEEGDEIERSMGLR